MIHRSKENFRRAYHVRAIFQPKRCTQNQHSFLVSSKLVGNAERTMWWVSEKGKRCWVETCVKSVENTSWPLCYAENHFGASAQLNQQHLFIELELRKQNNEKRTIDLLRLIRGWRRWGAAKGGRGPFRKQVEHYKPTHRPAFAKKEENEHEINVRDFFPRLGPRKQFDRKIEIGSDRRVRWSLPIQLKHQMKLNRWMMWTAQQHDFFLFSFNTGNFSFCFCFGDWKEPFANVKRERGEIWKFVCQWEPTKDRIGHFLARKVWIVRRWGITFLVRGKCMKPPTHCTPAVLY